jgi:predicted O-linked N-acetylglucosamine transferase (SPINDLY family)
LTPDQRFEAGFALHQQGRIAEAERIYAEVLRSAPRHFGALHSLGVIALQTRQYARAADWFSKSISVDRKYAPAHNNLGYALWALKRIDEAVASYSKAIALDRNYAEAYNNRGIAQNDLGRLREALSNFDKAIALRPDYANAHNNRGTVLKGMKRYGDALASYDKAIALRPDFSGAYSNRGNVLNELRHPLEALESIDKAIALDPNYAEAHYNRGNALSLLEQNEAALESYARALALKPDYAEIHYNVGLVLESLGRPEDALASFDKGMELDPAIEYLQGKRLLARMRLCDWVDFDSEAAAIVARVAHGERAIAPFDLMAVVDSAALHKQAAHTALSDLAPAVANLPPFVKADQSGAGGKIRIGYFSADFHDHAMAYLMAELYELHDKSKFEIIGFSMGPDSSSAVRHRLIAAFDDFVDIRKMSNVDAARLVRDRKIDIAVDLMVNTLNARPGIFAYRVAPIQVNYLGYPGTMAGDFMDYIIADRVVIPPDQRQYYSEKVAYVSGSYQVNDRKREIADRTVTRAELGLPPTGFVFGCFNNIHKLTPATFHGWMRILGKVEGSVLWLLVNNARAADNLRREAARLGIDADRLVFARNESLASHLARIRAADLFLDTLPYNAHTTTSDALWSGLPVITRIGESFPARVAASLLTAVGLPELITTTQEDYEALAIDLAYDAQRLGAIRQKLMQNLNTAPLFDTEAFTRQIEALYARMHERYTKGMRPDHLLAE